MRPYQTYLGAADTAERSQAACETIRYVSDAAAVACRYAQAVAQVVADMERSWDDLALRSHSAAAAILAHMSTMPAVGTAHLYEVTGQSPRAVRRALADLAGRGAVAETVDDDTGQRVFELPEMLRVVDQRQDLLADYWELHRGAHPQAVIGGSHAPEGRRRRSPWLAASEVLARFRDHPATAPCKVVSDCPLSIRQDPLATVRDPRIVTDG